MKIFKFFLFILLVSYSFISKGNVINKEIVKKYDKIFSNNILSNNDKLNYQKIFDLQDNCKWKKANKSILRIQNKILFGHVLAQRYLHPRCYRSEFIELTYWLKKYSDHPQAKKIYKLAVKRMPTGYKNPTKPIGPIGIKKEKLEYLKSKNKYRSQNKLSKNQRLEKQKLINAIKSRVNKGWPTGAAKLLNQRDVSVLLDQVEIDQITCRA